MMAELASSNANGSCRIAASRTRCGRDSRVAGRLGQVGASPRYLREIDALFERLSIFPKAARVRHSVVTFDCRRRTVCHCLSPYELTSVIRTCDGRGTLRADWYAVIDALDHLTIAGSAAAYETLLGRGLVDGRLQTGNVGLHVRRRSDQRLSSMVFATPRSTRRARLLERRGVATTTSGDARSCRAARRTAYRSPLVERSGAPAPSPLDRRRSIGDLRARPRRHPHAQPRARHRLLCRPAGPRSSARPQQSRLGLAAAVLPLRRSRRRDRARSEGRRVGSAPTICGACRGARPTSPRPMRG